ncbi:PREDICTED: polyribonucleotide nucleotidyltransferase 1, mitochondrial-like [Amphimedon queenslandica]|uniref:S1 motif domain-containing protein n=1 Tax=Amphimedon queenslandica TaxID=400682 RepID=A0A1X7UVL0_AMPQE|nr:PREDICTED: polyribonucleotide nucleotidyltransferase 1, mitochondrial-like [Amphimedon queenslandica]|eukprot:XP_011403999.1 PREDICTED: polyribonucleotide nucleotidyltransferase 1, mitochondrial-like [Amphimedon queenslandica]
MSKPAAGVACGLMMDGTDYVILSDLSGIEDAAGYMDFKVAGTRDGITSFQLDIKDCEGLPYDIIANAFMLSKEARHRVLDKMDDCQSKPRQQLKSNTPVYETIHVPSSKRWMLVGSGGHRIKALMQETGVYIGQLDDETMSVFAPTQLAMNEVTEKINTLLYCSDHCESGAKLEIGAVYKSRIIDIKPSGVLIEMIPTLDRAMVFLAQLDHKLVSHPDDLGLQLGQEIAVKYFGRDPHGHIRVSRRALLANPFRRPKEDGQSLGSASLVETAILDHVKATVANKMDLEGSRSFKE